MCERRADVVDKLRWWMVGVSMTLLCAVWKSRTSHDNENFGGFDDEGYCGMHHVW